MSTLWNKGTTATEFVNQYTVGQDRILDLRLAKHDIVGSKAHIKMLLTIGLLTDQEEKVLQKGLDDIEQIIQEGKFNIDDHVEDVHSQIELMLTKKLGNIGKKIHSGRSRNDQVLTDIKLLLKEEITIFKEEIYNLFCKLIELSEKYKKVLLPGYTHAQIAMPSSFGLWFGAYAESLIDDIYMFNGAYNIVNQCPLGSAAGYGSSFPLDRELTKELLGFRTLNFNSIAAQMSRGKSEKALAYAMSQLASTLNKLASDCCMYMCNNFSFISFPDDLTTGSSIMPHKKNPDVWELIRGNCNIIQNVVNEITLLTTNMPSGYFRDYQLLKEILFPSLDKLHKAIFMTKYMLDNIIVNKEILKEKKYKYLFTVEQVNYLVMQGMTFRDAYLKVGIDVKNNNFQFEGKLKHKHIGSIGNLANAKIKRKMKKAISNT